MIKKKNENHGKNHAEVWTTNEKLQPLGCLDSTGFSETLASAVFQKANAYSDTLSGWKQIKISFKDGAGDIKGGQARPRTRIEPRRANQIPLPPPECDLVAVFFVWTISLFHKHRMINYCEQSVWLSPLFCSLQPFERPVPVWHFFGLCSLWRTWILLRHFWSF